MVRMQQRVEVRQRSSEDFHTIIYCGWAVGRQQSRGDKQNNADEDGSGEQSPRETAFIANCLRLNSAARSLLETMP